jgi:hypothetical protein
MTFFEIQVDDIVQLRKQHPCGGWEWRVFRTGADIGVVCLTCQRRLMLPRPKFRRAVKKVVQRGTPASVDEKNAIPDNDLVPGAH